MESLATEHEFPTNPLDLMEELVSANDWAFDRHSESELMVGMSGQWCDHHMHFIWQWHVSAIFFSCHFDVRVPEARRTKVFELLCAVNEKLWLGHFDMVADDGVIMFRHTVPLRGAASVSIEQLEDLVDTAVGECDRLYPALQSVVWGGQSVNDAIAAALMETVGEA